MEFQKRAVEDIGKAASHLQVLVKELGQSQQNATRSSELADRITGLVEDMHAINFNRKEHNSALIQIHTCAVTLWNLAVAMKTGGTTNNNLNARLRHAACNLSFLANASDTTEPTYRKQLVMAAKTGKAWLDCDNPSMADNSLSLATECWDNLQKIWSALQGQQNITADQERQRSESERYIFRVYCYKAEAATSLSQNLMAHESVEKAKVMLSRLPKENPTLSTLCYNFGVTTYYRKEYEDCINWLRESVELGKGKNSVGHKKQAMTLRLMANAYLNWDSKEHLQKALNAVGLANAEHPHPAGHYLKIELLLMAENTPSSRLQSAFEEALRHPALSVQMGLSLVQLANQYQRTDSAFECLQLLASRFQNSPDLAKIQLEHLGLLLQNKQIQEAKELVEDCITGHNTGLLLDDDMRKMFHILLWEKAAAMYEAKDYQEAIVWYNYSLSLFTAEETMSNKNVAKLLRNKCSCYVILEDYTKAREAATESERIEPDSPVVHFYQFKIALLQGVDEKAMEAITKMSETGTKQEQGDDVTMGTVDVHGLICVAAQLSLEQNNREVAVRALEIVIQTSSSNKQVLTALRCLIRLKLTICETEKRNEESAILFYLKTALDRLSQLPGVSEVASLVQTEATWFMKIAWNMALDSSDASRVREFFLLCYKFADLVPIDLANMTRQKNCLLMAAAASLQMAKETSDETEKRDALTQTLSHVQNCRDLCKRINAGVGRPQPSRDKKDDSVILLILYEFEAKAKLGEGDASLESCLQKLMALPYCEPKTFETLAALAVEPPAYYRDVSMKSLRLAIKKHKASEQVDFNNLSKTFHSLAELALNVGSSSDATSKEEAWAIYQEILEVIEGTEEGAYPEMELIWLMTKSWNCGINLFSSGRLEAAEKWCATAMRFLQRLLGFKTNYESKMTGVYSEILSRIERASAHAIVEE